MTHSGKKKILSNWSSSCVLFWMKEERWLDLLLAQECAVFLLQYFNNILSVFQNKHKIPHLCLLFPFPKPALQNKASDKTTYVLYLNGLSSWHLYQISIHRKCRGLGRESQQDYCPSLGKYLTVQFQLFWILRFYHRVNVSFCDVKLYILPQYRLRISFFFWDEPCGGTTKRP